MKDANQMKEITYKHSKIIQWIEETLSAEIEKAAEAGSREYGVKIPTIYYDLTKDETYSQIHEYLKKFGYVVTISQKRDKIWISW